MLNNFEIKPNIGYGNITFGLGMDEFVEKFGEPEEIDHFDEDEQMNTTVLHYWKAGFSAFFVGLASQILAGIEVDHPKTTLFGEEILGKPQEFIINLMKQHGMKAYETETEDDEGGEGHEIRLSYEESMMDFFFREGALVYMNFGMFIDENGNIQAV
ncbi:MAG: hypothetical protein CVT99_00500 [Bacteroidetes bacterium HGW-Bacteroidetes-16]|jgi:hypothetical protein|nr:MAG: hypothetical protein CVT99_00500 [Bacteroidetes bacterium HGW-Bacteroidetes-16]